MDGPTDRIGALVARLRGDGAAVARGRFRLDPAAALKLRASQLAEPHDYILLLVSSALVRGATFVYLTATTRRLELLLNGTPDAPAELEDLMGALVDSTPRPAHARLLAMGLNGAWDLRPAHMEVACWDGNRGARLVLEPDGSRLEPLAAPPWDDPRATVRVAVEKRRTLLGTLTAGAGSSREAAIVVDSFALAPPSISIVVNRRRVNPPADFGPCLALSVTRGSDPSVALELAPSRASLLRERQVDGGSTMAVAVGGRWYRRKWIGNLGATIAFVVDGQAVVEPCGGAGQPDLGCGSVRAVVMDPRLRLDLARRLVVRDGVHRELVEAVRREVAGLLDAIDEEWDLVARRDAERMATSVLHDRIRALRVRGDARSTLSSLEKLYAYHDLSLSRSESYGGDATRRLASALLRLGRVDDALELLEWLLERRRGRWRSVSEEQVCADIAACHLARGNTEQAHLAARRAWRLARRRYSRQTSPLADLVVPAEILATTCAAVDDWREGVRVRRDVARRVRRVRHWDGDGFRVAVRFYRRVGELDEAVRRSRAWREQCERELPWRRQDRSWLVLQSEAWLHEAVLHLDRDDPDGAAGACQAALADLVPQLGESHPAVGGALALVALVERERGQPDAATRAARRALHICRATFGDDHPESERRQSLLEAIDRGGEATIEVCDLPWWLAYDVPPASHRPLAVSRGAGRRS